MPKTEKHRQYQVLTETSHTHVFAKRSVQVQTRKHTLISSSIGLPKREGTDARGPRDMIVPTTITIVALPNDIQQLTLGSLHFVSRHALINCITSTERLGGKSAVSHSLCLHHNTPGNTLLYVARLNAMGTIAEDLQYCADETPR